MQNKKPCGIMDPMLEYVLGCKKAGAEQEKETEHKNKSEPAEVREERQEELDQASSSSEVMCLGQSVQPEGAEDALDEITFLDNTSGSAYNITTEKEQDTAESFDVEMQMPETVPGAEEEAIVHLPITQAPIRESEWRRYASAHEEAEIAELSHRVCEYLGHNENEAHRMLAERRRRIQQITQRGHREAETTAGCVVYNHAYNDNISYTSHLRDQSASPFTASAYSHEPLHFRQAHRDPNDNLGDNYSTEGHAGQEGSAHLFHDHKGPAPDGNVYPESSHRGNNHTGMAESENIPGYGTKAYGKGNEKSNQDPEVLSWNQARALVCLQVVFRLQAWRQNQREIVEAALEGKDVFVLMPTGGGKSLTFQLPAVLSQGVTVVVSPLLALIQDQVKNLLQRGIPALALTSALTKRERVAVHAALQSVGETLETHRTGEAALVKIVYVTPELLVVSRSFNSLLEWLAARGGVARFVIDEAHCVSQWGHDFRPDYTQMRMLKENYPKVPITAVTATATAAVQKDILGVLGMKERAEYRQSFNRPNLRYSVRTKAGDPLPEIVSFIGAYYPEDSGIIYCLSKRECEWLSEQLNGKYGLRTGYYHAGLGTKERQRTARRWDTGEIKVVVATIAFGMGIDKKDVRYVIHYSLPKSLEGYYQETGRAGRDQLESECVLYYAYADKKKIDFLIERGETSAEAKSRQRECVRQVIEYCENRAECRRYLLLHYFGERFAESCGDDCDNCRTRGQLRREDCTADAQGLYRLVRRKGTVAEAQAVTEYKRQTGCRQTKEKLTRILRWMVGKGHLQTKLVMGARGFSWSYLRTGLNEPEHATISVHPNDQSLAERVQRAAGKQSARQTSNSKKEPLSKSQARTGTDPHDEVHVPEYMCELEDF